VQDHPYEVHDEVMESGEVQISSPPRPRSWRSRPPQSLGIASRDLKSNEELVKFSTDVWGGCRSSRPTRELNGRLPTEVFD
jgi:hypothetical protein